MNKLMNHFKANMQAYLILFFLFRTIPVWSDQGLVHDWSKSFGDLNSSQEGRCVALDSANNVIMTGFFWGTVDFGGSVLTSSGGLDIFLAKLDPNGDHLWSKRFGDSSDQTAITVINDNANNLIITGSFEGTVDFGGGPLTSAGESDIFLVKLDSNGNHLWSRNFGDSDHQSVSSTTVDNANNVIITGSFEGTVDFGGGPLTSTGNVDIFIAKFDSNGNYIWSRIFGDSEAQLCRSVTVDSTNNVIITGCFEGTVDFGGGPLTSAGGYTGGDIFLAKFDLNGTHIWSKCFGDSVDQRSNCVTVDSTNNVIIAGQFGGTIDFGGGPLSAAGHYDIFLVKFDPNGGHIWSNKFGEEGYQNCKSVAVDSSNQVIITGAFHGTIDFGGGPLTSPDNFDIFLVKFDPDSNHIWSNRFGNFPDQFAYNVAVDSTGNVILTGCFYGFVNFGGEPLTSEGGDDIFLAKFNPMLPPTGATLFMPSHEFHPDDICSCAVTVCNATGTILSEYPLFVILDVYGALYFAPGFTEDFDNYLDPYPNFPAGETTVTVVDEFRWPDKMGRGSGIVFYGALTTPEISEIFGEWDSWEFGWSE